MTQEEIGERAVLLADVFANAIPYGTPLASVILACSLLIRFNAGAMGLSKIDVQKVLVSVFDKTSSPELLKDGETRWV